MLNNDAYDNYVCCFFKLEAVFFNECCLPFAILRENIFYDFL